MDKELIERMPEVVYSSQSQLREPRQFVRNFARDVSAARELAWLLLARNLRTQYRQSAFGYVWAFVPPLVTTITWIFLNAAGILHTGTIGIPYPIYVITGIVLWQGFVDALNSPLTQLTANRALLSKVNFPREALILAGLGEVVFNAVIRLALLLCVFIAFRVPLASTLLLAPLGIVALLGLGLGIGLLLAPLGLLYQDVARGLNLVATLWFFVTPIVYVAPATGFIAPLLWLNPVTPLLVTTRDWLTGGSTSQLLAFMTVSCFAFLTVIVGWAFLRLAMPHLIARMAAR